MVSPERQPVKSASLFCIIILSCFALLQFCVNASAQTQIIYDNQLETGWQNWSWATVNLANTTPVHSGNDSISVYDDGTSGGFESLWLHPSADMSTVGFQSFTFWIYDTNPVNQSVIVHGISGNNTVNGSVSLPTPPIANTWTQETILLSSVGCSNISNFAGFWLQNATNGVEPAYYLDDVTLDWQQASGPISSAVTVNAAGTIGIIPTTQQGVNTATWDGYLTDSNTVPLLQQAGIKMLRYPGGSWSDAYHWQTNTGTTGATVYPNQNDYFDAFMTKLALPLGAMPIITCNYGSNAAGTAGGDPNEAAAWVQYSNITKGYGVKYWEIGNEVYGGWEEDLWPSADNAVSNPTFYGQEVVQYVNAMKAMDPTIKVGVVLQLPGQGGDSWNQAVMAQCGTKIDFVIQHWYPEYVNDNDYILLGDPSQVPGFMAGMKTLITKYCGANAANVQVLVTETNSDAGNPGKQMLSTVNALFMADNIESWLENGAANVDYWDLRNGAGNGDDDTSLFGSLMYGDEGILSNGSSTLLNGVTYSEPPVDTPFSAYYAEQMISYLGQPGDRMITSGSDHPFLVSHAVQKANGTMDVLLINKDAVNSYNVTVNLNAFAATGNATAYLYGPNTSTITSSQTAGSNALSLSLPPYTMETISIPQAVIPTPVIAPTSGSFVGSVPVSITDSQASVTIKYTTDGSDPLTSATSQNYGSSFMLSSNAVVKTVAVAAGYANSAEVSSNLIVTPATPQLKPGPGPGKFFSAIVVSIKDATTGATVLYTTDGSDPASSATAKMYTGPFVIATSSTVTTVAQLTGDSNSAESSMAYVVTVATPIVKPGSATYIGAINVSMSDVTPGTTIKYTTDGSDPLSSPTAKPYSGKVLIKGKTTLTVVGTKIGDANSFEVTNSYIVVP